MNYHLALEWLFLAASLAGTSGCSGSQKEHVALSAPQRPAESVVVDTYFGETVRDPERWLEALESPRVKNWVKEQDERTTAWFAALHGMDRLREHVREVGGATADVADCTPTDTRTFCLERGVGRQKYVLKVIEATGASRSLVDIENSSEGSIDYVVPSPSGKLVAYGLSSAGTEDATLHVMRVDDGTLVGPALPRARFARVEWSSDEKTLYATREPERAANAPASDAFTELRTERYSVGKQLTFTGTVFGFGHAPSSFVKRTDFPYLLAPHEASFKLGITWSGVDPLREVSIAPKGENDLLWKQIIRREHEVLGVALHGSTLFVLTTKGSSSGRVEAWSLAADGTVGSRRVLLDRPELVLRHLVDVRSGVYVHGLEDGGSKLLFIPFSSEKVEPVVLPGSGSVMTLSGASYADDLLFRFESWRLSPRWYRHSPKRGGNITDTGFARPSPVTFDDIAEERIEVRSADGTMVPLTVLRPKASGRRPLPTWLGTYGAYGVPQLPNFRAFRRAWFDMGGQFAVAHVRGGGERGRAWHLGGKQLKKRNSIDDFIACAQSLIDRGLASSSSIGAWGQSAGGIVVSNAAIQRPDLFGAVVVDVGYSNMLRLEVQPGGHANAVEFGSIQDPEGFRSLRDMDAYHAVKPGVRYPAFLFSTGINDQRVPPWHSMKMVAALSKATTSGAPVLLRIRTGDGHGFGSALDTDAMKYAEWYGFLMKQLSGSLSRSE